MRVRGGIDPGKRGFIVIHCDDDIYYFPMPMIGKEYNISEFQSIIKRFSQGNDIFFCIEKVNAIQKAGSTSNFQFGRGTMLIESTLTFCGVPFELVLPRKWQKVCHEGVMRLTKPNPKNTSGVSADTKGMSLIAAKRLYPDVDFRRTTRCTDPDDNKVDALLISHYCLMKYR